MHETYMKRAISEALKGKGQTFTNPLVGAVIVKDEEIVAVGSHMAYGQPHAEKNAIDSCSSPEKLIDSTIYVTLEPCHHYGKQPPCTTAILQSGIKKVVIGSQSVGIWQGQSVFRITRNSSDHRCFRKGGT